MRSEQEIRHAVEQLKDLARGADDAMAAAYALGLADALEWALGSKTGQFGQMIAAMDAFDADMERRMRN